MNMDKGAIKNSAFAIIAIESVWPNPQGNEVPEDFYDFELLGIDPQKANRAGLKRERFQTSSSSTNLSDYQSTKGYYKLIPLNIIRADTKTTLSGSNFEVTFTLDDLLLVTDNDTDFLNATGLPFSREDLISLGDQKTLPVLFNDNEKNNWDYVKDEDLGLTRYKINGSSSSFNIEDLVEPNDTITIWIYHDPADFYVKNEIPSVIDGNYKINDDLSNVVGSADRRSQFNDSSTDFQEYIVSTLGLANEYTAEVIESVVATGESPEIKLTLERFLFALNAFVSEGLESLDRGADEFNFKEGFASFAEGFNVPRDSAAYRFLLEPYAFPDGERPQIVLETNEFAPIIRDAATKAWNGSDFEYNEEENFELSSLIPAYRIQTVDNSISAQNFIIGLKNFKSYLEQVSTEYVNESLKTREYSFIEQRFSNGRQALVTDFTGETPYLALKGKVGDVSTSVGHKQGSYTVTLTGSGYEKTLNEQEVFYEDVFFPETYRFANAEYVSKYILVSPPRAMLDVINRHASKNLIFKSVDTLSPLQRASYLTTFTAIQEDAEDIKENFRQIGDFFADNVIARGNFLASDYTENLSKEDIRVFYPVNFLDTTRVYEMVRALDVAYTDEEAIYRSSQSLRGGTSVFQNLRMLGGTEQLYEMFVDESGKFRYRFTFEAYERTPKPSITPTIQDEDLLPGSRFSVTDSRLSTSVTVLPAAKAATYGRFGIPFLGRAVPEASSVPLKNISIVAGSAPSEDTPGLRPDSDFQTTVNLDDTLSSTLFRYGLQTLTIEDVYTAPSQSAKRKAILYLNLFGEPLKQAKISTLNNTSYRVGNTVLVSLQKNKHRSKKVVELDKMISWLEEVVLPDDDLIDLYVGVDDRLLLKNTYVPTSNEDYLPIKNSKIFNEFTSQPKTFVLKQFIKTFKYLRDKINASLITPDYFPPTLWYYLNDDLSANDNDNFVGWQGNSIRADSIEELYSDVLSLALNDAISKNNDTNERARDEWNKRFRRALALVNENSATSDERLVFLLNESNVNGNDANINTLSSGVNALSIYTLVENRNFTQAVDSIDVAYNELLNFEGEEISSTGNLNVVNTFNSRIDSLNLEIENTQTLLSSLKESNKVIVDEIESIENEISEKEQLISAVGVDISNKVIVIDAGHGGSDPGATYDADDDGTNEKFEKDYVLPYALALKSALSLAGYQTRLTRSSDTFLGIDERVNIANLGENDLMISIHFDFFANENLKGKDLIYYSPNNPKSNNLAQKIDKYFGSNDLRSTSTSRFGSLGVVDVPNGTSVLIEVDNIKNATLDTGTIASFTSQVVRGVQDYFEDVEPKGDVPEDTTGLEEEISELEEQKDELQDQKALNDEEISSLTEEQTEKQNELLGVKSQKQDFIDGLDGDFDESTGTLSARAYSEKDLTSLVRYQELLRSLNNTVVEDLGINDGASYSASIQRKLVENPGIINALKFQDFRTASYYIESVNHRFEHGKDASTSLTLNYGQDNLVLLEPKNNIPIGFISLEKNMALGYESDEQAKLFLDGQHRGERSGEQKMFIEQFKENKKFEEASVMYQAQKIRNASNYMYKLGLVEGLDTESNEFSQDVRSSREIIEQYEVNTTTFADAPEVDTRGLSLDFYNETGRIIAEFETTYREFLPSSGVIDIVDSFERGYNEYVSSIATEAFESSFTSGNIASSISQLTAGFTSNQTVSPKSASQYVTDILNKSRTQFEDEENNSELINIIKDNIGGN